MRTRVVSLVAVALAVGATTVNAQGTRTPAPQSAPQPSRRDSVLPRSPLPTKMPDSGSFVFRSMTANEGELVRMVQEIQVKEANLLRGLAQAREDETARRRLFEELQALNREAFTVMSIVEGRCMATRTASPQGYMGVSVNSTVTASDSPMEVLHSVIESVEPGSPADQAGLMAGDRLLNVGGRDTRTSWPDLASVLQPGRRIVVRVNRDGQERELPLTVGLRQRSNTVTVCPVYERAIQPLRAGAVGRAYIIDTTDASGNRMVFVSPTPMMPKGGAMVATTPTPQSAPSTPTPPTAANVVAAPTPPPPPIAYSYSVSTGNRISYFAGAQLRALDDDWRAVLNIRAGTVGVLVNEVAPGSAAATSGLKVGDVITHVNDTEATSPFVVSRLMGLSENATATLRIIRAGQRRTVTVRWDG